MPRVHLTPEAVGLARRLIATFDDCDEPTTAILGIHWTAGVKENRRGPNGEVVWETIEPARWIAEIRPWSHSGDARLEDYAINIDGIPVLVVGYPKPASGSFTVSEVRGEFKVENFEA